MLFNRWRYFHMGEPRGVRIKENLLYSGPQRRNCKCMCCDLNDQHYPSSILLTNQCLDVNCHHLSTSYNCRCPHILVNQLSTSEIRPCQGQINKHREINYMKTTNRDAVGKVTSSGMLLTSGSGDLGSY